MYILSHKVRRLSGFQIRSTEPRTWRFPQRSPRFPTENPAFPNGADVNARNPQYQLHDATGSQSERETRKTRQQHTTVKHYFKCKTALHKKRRNLRVPSKLRCKPSSFTAKRDLIGLFLYKKILYVCRKDTLRFLHKASSSLLISFILVSSGSLGKSQGRGIMPQIIRLVEDFVRIFVIKS